MESKAKASGGGAKSPDHSNGPHKFKSAAQGGMRHVNTATEWKQPLKRHINPQTEKVEFVTILVRVLSGDSEHDFHARFPPTPLYAKKVCSAIASKEQLDDEEAQLFRLWVISKDLEIQIRPDQDIFELMIFWNRWVMKYTHFPEAEDPKHHINRHWFIYRRETAVSIATERRLAGDLAINLLYGEAKRNILTKRYVCSQLEAATLAGYQLQMAYGDYNSQKCKPGYLDADGRLDQLLPNGFAEKMRASQWEEIITVQYKTFLGMDPLQCRHGFLEFIRNMPCYGCAFFPCCTELPPSGFFELRTQNWFIGIGPNGMCIIDSDIQKYVYIMSWKDIQFRAGPDQFHITQTKAGKKKEIPLITPQGNVIENLGYRLQYNWAKEFGPLKEREDRVMAEGMAIIAAKKRGSTIMLLSKSQDLSKKSTSQQVIPVMTKELEGEEGLRPPEPSNLRKSAKNIAYASIESLGKRTSDAIKQSIERINRHVKTSTDMIAQYFEEEPIPANTEIVSASREELNDAFGEKMNSKQQKAKNVDQDVSEVSKKAKSKKSFKPKSTDDLQIDIKNSNLKDLDSPARSAMEDSKSKTVPTKSKSSKTSTKNLLEEQSSPEKGLSKSTKLQSSKGAESSKNLLEDNSNNSSPVKNSSKASKSQISKESASSKNLEEKSSKSGPVKSPSTASKLQAGKESASSKSLLSKDLEEGGSKINSEHQIPASNQKSKTDESKNNTTKNGDLKIDTKSKKDETDAIQEPFSRPQTPGEDYQPSPPLEKLSKTKAYKRTTSRKQGNNTKSPPELNLLEQFDMMEKTVKGLSPPTSAGVGTDKQSKSKPGTPRNDDEQMQAKNLEQPVTEEIEKEIVLQETEKAAKSNQESEKQRTGSNTLEKKREVTDEPAASRTNSINEKKAAAAATFKTRTNSSQSFSQRSSELLDKSPPQSAASQKQPKVSKFKKVNDNSGSNSPASIRATPKSSNLAKPSPQSTPTSMSRKASTKILGDDENDKVPAIPKIGVGSAEKPSTTNSAKADEAGYLAPLPNGKRRKSSAVPTGTLGTTAAGRGRKKSISAAPPGQTISKRSDNIFNLDDDLDGVGPTELLDLRDKIDE